MVATEESMMNFPLTKQSNPPNLVVQLRTSYFHPSNCQSRGTGIRPSSVISSLCATQYTRVGCVCSFVIALQSFPDHSWDINSDILSGWFQWAWRFIWRLLSNHNGHGSNRTVLNLIISRTQHIISQYFFGCTMHLIAFITHRDIFCIEYAVGKTQIVAFSCKFEWKPIFSTL